MDEQARCDWIGAHILPHEGEVRGWLRRCVSTLPSEDVDDVLQEAYARIWSGSTDFRQIRNGRAYFFTVVRNLLSEQARRACVVPMERLGEIESSYIISNEPGPERQSSARQALERVLRIIAELPPRCRRAFELQKFGGLSQREIARNMKISEKTVELHLAKALARVTDAIGAESGPIGKAPAAFGTREYGAAQQED
jgi:RNA polymerase sigma factor (sigma-70 family)